MSVLTRIRDMATATWNDLTEPSYHPEREVEAYIRAQQKHLEEADHLYQQTLVQAIALREQYMTAEQQAEKRGEQALLALRVGEEELAKLILEEKRQADEISKQAFQQYEQCQFIILELAEELKHLRTKYAEAVDQREVYAARMESARLAKQMEERNDRGHRDTLTELQETGRDIGREVSGALREAGRIGKDIFREASVNVQQELREVRGKLHSEWPKANKHTGYDTADRKQAE
jgi:phage shock protein A